MATPLCIALVSPQASPLSTHGRRETDAERIYAAQVARWLALMGHKVDVLTRRDDPSLPTVADLRPGVRVRHIDAGPARPLSMAEFLTHAPEFSRHCETLLRNGAGYHIVHANGFTAGLVARHLKEALGLPYAASFHTLSLAQGTSVTQADGLAPSLADIEQRVVDNADAVIAQCPRQEVDLTRLYQADARRLRMVPSGIDVNEFTPVSRQQARAELGLDAGEFLILHIDHATPQTDAELVIRALAHLPAYLPARLPANGTANMPANPPARLLVVGGLAQGRRSQPRHIRQLAHDCGVLDKVSFKLHPPGADLRLYHAAADVFVAAPRCESTCATPLEAMASGTPVVASNVGGLNFAVTDGVTGYLVPPDEPQALAGCLAHLQANPRLARAMGRAGMHRVRSLFTWERVARLLLATYEDVLHQSRGAEPVSHTDFSAWHARHDIAAVG